MSTTNTDVAEIKKAQGKFLWWMLGSLLSVLMVFGGVIYGTVSGRVDELTRKHEEAMVKISASEANVGGIKARLDRIEDKLDRLLERK